jgi:phage terminase small subunit
MPRRSPEALAGIAWRTRNKLQVKPMPPGYLSREAKKLWVDIVSSRPPDYFDAGSLPLLEAYCEATVHSWDLMKRIGDLPGTPANDRESARLERRSHKYVATLLGLATKLRLTPQANIRRGSAMLREGGWGDVNPLLRGRREDN